MDDEEETYRLWKIRKTIMQVRAAGPGGAWRAVGQQGLRGGRVLWRWPALPCPCPCPCPVPAWPCPVPWPRPPPER